LKALELSRVIIPIPLQNLVDAFEEKKKGGQQVQTHGSGFGGKGFKFDESEEAKRLEGIKQQKKAWGVEEEEEEEEVAGDDESSSSSTSASREKETSSSSSSVPGIPNTIAGVAIPPGLAQVNPGTMAIIVSGINSLPSASQSELPGIREHIAQQIKSVLSDIQKLPSTVPPATKAQYVGTMLSIHAAMIKPVTAAVAKSHFDAELEINDYPQQARWKVTHKDALANITEWTGAAITTRGTYVPPGGKLNPGERKLYLYIEGQDEHGVATAKREIKKMIEEAAANAPPDRPQFGKYSITF